MGNFTGTDGSLSPLCQGCWLKDFALLTHNDSHDCKSCRMMFNRFFPEERRRKTMTLKDTVDMMTSENWKDRFVAEYRQTKIRYEKLHKLIIKREVGKHGFETPIPLDSWKEQAYHMGLYLYELEKQAAIHGIDLDTWGLNDGTV